MTSKSRTLLLLFALLGLGASSVSTFVHYKLLTTPNYDSFCDVGSTVSCTQAYLSQYGSLMGIPVAIAGVIFFAIVTLLAGMAGGRSSAARDNAAGYIFLLSTIGLAFTLYLAWASYFKLNVFCILCAITYVSVVALFIISGGATKYPMTTLPSRASHDIRALAASPAALIALLVVLGGSVALVASFPNEQAAAQQQAEAVATYQPLSPEQRKQVEDWWNVQPVVEVPITPSPGTKVLIVKFSDYMCPSCGIAHNSLKAVLPKYQDQGVEFVLKHYPLEAECNPKLGGGNHYGSCEAAAAYEMAKGTPNVAKLDDWFFGNQRILSRETVKEAAEDIAGIKDFDARYAAAIETVKTDASLGHLMGVKSTPTIFINGRQIPGGGQPPAIYDMIIELALRK